MSGRQHVPKSPDSQAVSASAPTGSHEVDALASAAPVLAGGERDVAGQAALADRGSADIASVSNAPASREGDAVTSAPTSTASPPHAAHTATPAPAASTPHAAHTTAPAPAASTPHAARTAAPASPASPPHAAHTAAAAHAALTIREATDADRPALEQVLLEAYGQYAAVLSESRWADYKASILQSIDEAPTRARLVAELGGELVGSVFLFDSSALAYGHPELGIDSPIIRLLAVAPRARGAGVATELIRASARRALAAGAATLHLHTSDMMDSAVRLYERLGFERAYDKEFMNGDLLVKSYRLQLAHTPLLQEHH